jgi:hypothetical protein
MINLIPPDARSRIVTEYWVRVVTAWLFLLAIAATVVGALLLPAYVLVTSQVNLSTTEADVARARVGEHGVTTKVLDAASEEARLIVTSAEDPHLTQVVETIESIIPAGVEATAYTITRQAGGVAPVTLRGIASTRTTLATFRDALLANPQIARVDLPISNFAKDRDISFTVTITVSSSTPAL